MKHCSSLEDLASQTGRTVVALGNFDGFHRGHHVVLGEAGRIARARGLPLAVMVTEPHPVRFFKPESPEFRLTPFEERAALLAAFGVDILLVLPFNQDLASTSADAFITTVLLDGLHAAHVVVGYDYRFGKGRQGDADRLRETGSKSNFDVSVIDAVTIGIDGFAGEVYSSSLVREALENGKPRRAAALLGHWWTISGKVIKGDQRGRTIGFPTANLALGPRIAPRHGVYAVRVSTDNGVTTFDGVANFGSRPTFDKTDVVLEVHLFDFNADLYDQTISVELVSFLRSEHKFNGLEALKIQIKQDCLTARTVLTDPENDRARLAPPSLGDYLRLYPAAHPCAK